METRQREIKFRVVHNNEIVGIEHLTSTGWKWMYYLLNPDKGERWTNGVIESSKEYIRNQFTGLLDKNGKEIYEGDVLKIGYPINGADGEPDYLPLTVKVYFHGGAFWFKGDGYTDCNWHFYSSEHREVIGNIYSNPELTLKP